MPPDRMSVEDDASKVKRVGTNERIMREGGKLVSGKLVDHVQADTSQRQGIFPVFPCLTTSTCSQIPWMLLSEYTTDRS
jgi:hypothetical protein